MNDIMEERRRTLLLKEEDNIDYSKEYFTIISLEDNNQIGWKMYLSGSGTTKNLSVSTNNGVSWTTTDYSSSSSELIIATLNKGEKMLIKAPSPFTTYGGSRYYTYFSSTKDFEVAGNIMSLYDGREDKFSTYTTLDSNYAFKGLFKNCSHLKSAKNLVLPAITLLGNNCYEQMFSSCTSLIAAPELPATTLAQYCYCSMFSSCRALTTAPILPALTLDSYCYDSMFSNCTSLNYIKAMFTTPPTSIYTNYWLYNVASTGTFVKNTAATWAKTGTDGIPNGWTVETADS